MTESLKMTVKLSKSQIEILGRPNFACAQIAKVLINSGEYEKGEDKSEYEQAVYIHWALNLLEKHGENWKDAGHKTLKDILSKSINQQNKGKSDK